MREVVGAAICVQGRVLAARRIRPAGRWELPGGKVENGESAEAALLREVREELGVEVRLERWLPGLTPVRPDLVLRVAVVSLVDRRARGPRARRAAVARSAELDDVDWLEPDRPFLFGHRGGPRLGP